PTQQEASGAGSAEEAVPTPPTLKKGQLLLGTYRDLWADPAVESSPALRFLVPAQRLEISGPDATRLGLKTGDEVSVSSGERSVNARVAVRAALPEGTCFLIEGTPADNANVLSSGAGGPVAVEVGPPEVRLDLVTAGGPVDGDESA
ncbi:MAG: molybdopterin dinucleotide binding domain-containing protein, partial [Solirubrobacterales bacterium]